MRVLVTGCSGALGGAAARVLQAEGHSVVGLDLREDLATDLPVLACDVRDPAAVAVAVGRAADILGGLDLVLNAAGVGYVQDAGHPPDDLAQAVLEVNLLGPWRVTAAALPFLLADADDTSRPRPRVVTLASVLSEAPGPFVAAYCASKRGVTAWMDSLRAEYGSVLDVVTVHPGYVKTPIHDYATGLGLSLDGLLPEDPLDRTVVAIVRACTGRPRRDVVTTPASRVVFSLSRHAPSLVEAATRRRVRALADAGTVPASGLSAGLVARVRSRQGRPRAR